MYPDIDRDRVSVHQSSRTTTWSHFSPVLASFFDAALQGSSDRYYTYQCRHSRMQSRIDHVFANLRYASYTMDTRLVPYTRSDHSALIVSFSDPSYSPHTLHRLNTSHLFSPSLQASTTPLLLPFRTPSLWDSTKTIARSHAQDFAAAAARRRHSDLRSLER